MSRLLAFSVEVNMAVSAETATILSGITPFFTHGFF